jgi:hypothetical protein
VEERREERRSAVTRAAERLDTYTAELHQLGLEASDREVRWLNELIAQERNLTPTSADPTGTAGPAIPTEPSTDPGSRPPEPSADPGSDPPSARDKPTDRPAR